MCAESELSSMDSGVQMNRAAVALVLFLSSVFFFGTWLLWVRLNPLPETDQTNQMNEETRVQLVEEVFAVVEKIGRTPSTQQQLEEFLGHKLPFVKQRGQLLPIWYHQVSNNQFMLQHILLESDDFVFDSSAPHLGWTKRTY